MQAAHFRSHSDPWTQLDPMRVGGVISTQRCRELSWFVHPFFLQQEWKGLGISLKLWLHSQMELLGGGRPGVCDAKMGKVWIQPFSPACGYGGEVRSSVISSKTKWEVYAVDHISRNTALDLSQILPSFRSPFLIGHPITVSSPFPYVVPRPPPAPLPTALQDQE